MTDRPVGPVHPLWEPYSPPTDEEIARSRVVTRPPAPVVVVDYDPGWPAAFDAVRDLVVATLDASALAVTHIGSTAVPGLAAKDLLDVDLIVADPADEPAYVPALESAGFVLRGRIPEWEEHRVLHLDQQPGVVLHVCSPVAREPRRHVLFRDWLRAHPADREAYAAHKREVAARGFTDSMHYNNAKAAFVYDLYERILLADPEHEHTPQPRTGARSHWFL